MPFPTKLLNDGEHVVITTRTHPKALFGPILRLIFVVALIVVALIVTNRIDNGALDTGIGVVVGVVAALVFVLWVLKPFLDWWFTHYTFTNRRFIKRSGIIAKEGRTIPLNRISGVDFEMGVIDRIFKCGTLVVSDASTDGTVELEDIPQVEQVQKRVSDELHRLTLGDHADDGA